MMKISTDKFTGDGSRTTNCSVDIPKFANALTAAFPSGDDEN
jgi:hypothetical protein